MVKSFENEAEKIIYEFYPKGLSIDSSKYVKSIEYNRLRNRIIEFGSKERTELFNSLVLLFKFNPKIKLIFKDFTLVDWLDRALNVQSVNETSPGIYHSLCINISIIAPYFCIYVLETEIDPNSKNWKSLPKKVESNIYLSEIKEIKKELIDYFKLKEFPSELLKKKIDVEFLDISKGEFNFFNGFFLNRYITRTV